MGQEALPVGQEWTAFPPILLGVVGRPSEKASIGWEAISDGQE